ncbi:hypothetical protein FRC05_004100 [Tulasnella sp. 425]|nr:hypothetical protein FRC05_004100 [Tulasnella sp. 425]
MSPPTGFNADSQMIASVTHNDGIPMVASPSPTAECSTSTVDQRVLPASFYDSYLSDTAKRYLPSPIRKVIPLSRIPGMLSLFAGLPAPETFPFQQLTVTVSHPDTANRDKSTTLTLEGEVLAEGLQYCDTAGIPKFVDWLCELQERYHGRKRDTEGWALSIGCGSQDVLSKAFTSLLNEGDSVLVEAPVYAGVIPIFDLHKCHAAEVSTDADGILADDLEHILQNWPKDKRKPKLLYTVPYGCNPTGASATLERRLKVLQLAREYNFLILEGLSFTTCQRSGGFKKVESSLIDDPYFYLYYGDAPRPPSYFQLEKEIAGPIGHVVRFDSFSKILSSGMRLGFVSGPTPVVTAINLITSSSTLQPSSFSQVVAYSLLSHWGYEGLQNHVDHIAGVYRRKRDLFAEAMRKHLEGLAEWSTPEAGMFVWFKLLLPPVPGSDEGDSEDVIVRRALKEKVLALPGTSFFTNGRTSAYVRASFSVLPEEQFDEAMRRLAAIIKEVRKEAERETGSDAGASV